MWSQNKITVQRSNNSLMGFYFNSVPRFSLKRENRRSPEAKTKRVRLSSTGLEHRQAGSYIDDRSGRNGRIRTWLQKKVLTRAFKDVTVWADSERLSWEDELTILQADSCPLNVFMRIFCSVLKTKLSKRRRHTGHVRREVFCSNGQIYVNEVDQWSFSTTLASWSVRGDVAAWSGQTFGSHCSRKHQERNNNKVPAERVRPGAAATQTPWMKDALEQIFVLPVKC